MNAKNPSHGRFSFALYTFLALGSAACGAAPDQGDDLARPAEYSSTPPSTAATGDSSRTDAGVSARASSDEDAGQPTGLDPAASSGAWPARGSAPSGRPHVLAN